MREIRAMCFSHTFYIFKVVEVKCFLIFIRANSFWTQFSRQSYVSDFPLLINFSNIPLLKFICSGKSGTLSKNCLPCAQETISISYVFVSLLWNSQPLTQSFNNNFIFQEKTLDSFSHQFGQFFSDFKPQKLGLKLFSTCSLICRLFHIWALLLMCFSH